MCPVLTSVFDAVDDFGTHDMEAATSVGPDIAKSVFWVHGIGAGGEVLIRAAVKALWSATFL